jgi:hypothetical protein
MQVSLQTDPPHPIAGTKTMMFFKLDPAEGIEKYIGAWGHMLAASDDLIDLIHTHPFVVAEEGSNAKLSKFADYGGWSVSSDSIDAWIGPQPKVKQTEWSNGDTCPFGKYKGKQGELTWAVDGKPRTGNPGDYHMKDGETLGIYFLPKGADQPFPPNACTAFNQINDNSTANLSKNSPCNAIDATTTTLPAETTTAPAATSTSSP